MALAAPTDGPPRLRQQREVLPSRRALVEEAFAPGGQEVGEVGGLTAAQAPVG